MLSFFRRHWVAYVVMMVVALGLGFGAAWIFNIKGSTPADIRAQRIKAEQNNTKSLQSITELEKKNQKSTSQSNGDQSGDPNAGQMTDDAAANTGDATQQDESGAAQDQQQGASTGSAATDSTASSTSSSGASGASSTSTNSGTAYE